MSPPVPESSALVRTTKEAQHGDCEPGHILAQLSAALENPDIKALEWSKTGRGVLVHAKLYEEEMGKNKELFPELADLSCVTALQAWLLAYGFKLKGAKVNSQVLLLQHPDFERVHPTTEELGTPGQDAGLLAEQQKKRKKKRRVNSLHPPRGVTSQDTLGLLQPVSYSTALAGKGLSALGSRTSPGRLPRLRPLYQYINFDMPELMHTSAEDEVPGLAQPNQVPAAPRRATAPQMEDTWASSAPKIPAPGVGDKSMQVDIDRMLRYTAHLVPPLFPLYK